MQDAEGTQAQPNFQQELTTLKEWQHLQHLLLAFPRSLPSRSSLSWRSAMETPISQNTQGRGCIIWGKSLEKPPEAFDRFYKLHWHKRIYGFLGLAPGYLVSATFPAIPQSLAQLCSLCLALAEYQTLIRFQLHQLPPLANTPVLTPREQEMLASLVRGESEEETAERLGIAQTTVHTHRQSLYRRLDVHSEQQARIRAFDLGVVDWLDFPMR
jgi:DNA-binding CsgD family transcriptional regulator